MLNDNARPRPRPGVELEELDGEVVIYHPETEAIFYCNTSAALVFRLCDGARDVSQITALLREAYPESAARIDDDVRTTLDALIKHGALDLP